MRLLQTVILQHVTRDGCHYDWLMEDPSTTAQSNPTGLLWTARVHLPPLQWQQGQRLMLAPIAPHRRAYLTYQGPISQNRGSVKRVAQGRFTAPLWTPGRRILHIQWQSPMPHHMQVAITLTEAQSHFVPTWRSAWNKSD